MASLTLPPILDLKASAALKAGIEAHAGAALDVDATQVERLGGLCLQVLIAAEAQWRGAGHAFRLIANEAFARDARLMGAAHLIEQGRGTC